MKSKQFISSTILTNDQSKQDQAKLSKSYQFFRRQQMINTRQPDDLVLEDRKLSVKAEEIRQKQQRLVQSQYRQQRAKYFYEHFDDLKSSNGHLYQPMSTTAAQDQKSCNNSLQQDQSRKNSTVLSYDKKQHEQFEMSIGLKENKLSVVRTWEHMQSGTTGKFQPNYERYQALAQSNDQMLENGKQRLRKQGKLDETTTYHTFYDLQVVFVYLKHSEQISKIKSVFNEEDELKVGILSTSQFESCKKKIKMMKLHKSNSDNVPEVVVHEQVAAACGRSFPKLGRQLVSNLVDLNDNSRTEELDALLAALCREPTNAERICAKNPQISEELISNLLQLMKVDVAPMSPAQLEAVRGVLNSLVQPPVPSRVQQLQVQKFIKTDANCNAAALAEALAAFPRVDPALVAALFELQSAGLERARKGADEEGKALAALFAAVAAAPAPSAIQQLELDRFAAAAADGNGVVSVGEAQGAFAAAEGALVAEAVELADADLLGGLSRAQFASLQALLRLVE